MTEFVSVTKWIKMGKILMGLNVTENTIDGMLQNNGNESSIATYYNIDKTNRDNIEPKKKKKTTKKYIMCIFIYIQVKIQKKQSMLIEISRVIACWGQ